MTPDEIRELRCECGHSALDQHEDDLGCWSCGCLRSNPEALASAVNERLAQAWDEALSYVWALNDPAYTILACCDPARDEGEAFLPLVTQGDIAHARRANPYRSHADSGRSAGALSDGQGSVRVRGSLVHNHAPYRPPCNERLVGGEWRGACLDDEGNPR